MSSTAPGEGNTSYYDENSTVILQEEIEDDYEPEPEEIEEYAKYLGMSLPGDNELLYIAKEGLKAPLPEPWKPCKTSTNEIYYFNFESGESIWEHPCDKHYKEQYLLAKQNMLKEGGSRSMGPVAVTAGSYRQQELAAAKDAAILPKSTGSNTNLTQKTEFQIKQMDTNYKNILDNYQIQKKEELKELKMQLLEEEDDDEESEELINYRENLENDLGLKFKEESLKKVQKVGIKKEEKKEECKKKEEEEKSALKINFDNYKIGMIEEAEKDQQKEISNTISEEKSRIQHEKRKLDFEMEEVKHTHQDDALNLSDLKTSNIEKIELEHSTQENRAKKTIHDLSLQIAKTKEQEISKLKHEQELKINTEVTKMKVDVNYKKIEFQEEKEKLRKEIENAYKYNKNEKDRSFEAEIDRIKQTNISELEEERIKLEIEMGVERDKSVDSFKLKKLNYQREFRIKLERYKEESEKELELEMGTYENEAKSRLEMMDLEFKELKESFRTQEELISEVEKIKERNYLLEGELSNKTKDLMSEIDISQNYKAKLNNLQAESEFKLSSPLGIKIYGQSAEEEQDEVFTLGRSLFQIDDTRISELKGQITQRDNQIMELRGIIQELTAINTRKRGTRITGVTGGVTDHVDDISTSFNQADLRQVTHDVAQLNNMLIKQNSARKPKGKGNRYQSPQFTELKQGFPTLPQHEFIPSSSKLKEILLFVTNEQKDLDEMRNHLLGEQKLFKKLKSQQDRGRREWRQELFKHRLDPSRKIVVESLKSKMEHECDILDKQINDIVQSIKKNEKKQGFLHHIDRKMEVLKNNLFKRDYGHMTQNLEKEILKDYEFYLKTYKFESRPQEQFPFDLPDLQAEEITTNLFPNKYHQRMMKEDKEFEYNYHKIPRISKDHDLQKNIWNYQNMAKHIYHRDFWSLAKSRERMMNVFVDQSNWLYQMKNEVSRTTNFGGLHRPFF